MLITKATVFLKRLADDLFELMWHIRVDPNRRHWWTLQNGIEDKCRSVAPERKSSRAHLVQHCPEGEQISASVEFFSSYLLRGHIGNRAQRRTGAGQLLLRLYGGCAHANALRFQRDFRQPEIENLRLTSIRNEDVRWLDVSMDDALRMCCIERVGNLDAEIEHRFDFQRLAIDYVPERLSVQQFHCDEGSPIDLINLIDRADVRMIQG